MLITEPPQLRYKLDSARVENCGPSVKKEVSEPWKRGRARRTHTDDCAFVVHSHTVSC